MRMNVMHNYQDQRLDWYLMLLLGMVAAYGLVMVFSASVAQAERIHDSTLYFGRNQLVYLVIGLCVAAVVWRIPLALWERYGLAFLAFSFLLLLLVLIPGVGKSVNGSQRWLNLGVSFQPSELHKVAVIVFLAGYFVRKGEQLRTKIGVFALPIIVAVVTGVLLIAETDYGATVIIAATVFAMMFLAGVRWLHIIGIVVLFVPVAVSLILISPYRRDRLFSFLNPWDDPFDTDFQLTQSLIAVGRGAFDGVGIGSSVQKMAYLPEAHTDFVFAVLAEETGLIGVTVILALFALIITRAFRIARDAERAGLLFGAYLATGVGFWIGLQAFVNIGANMGVLPTKGITLPFLSYGGSSALMTCFAFALVMRVHTETTDAQLQEQKRLVRAREEMKSGLRLAKSQRGDASSGAEASRLLDESDYG
jgi:cell division protein FtsW